MVEFGSDFQYIEPVGRVSGTLFDLYPCANYYADGRHPLIHLCQSQKWERLWVPEYFCYDVVETLKQAGVTVQFYTDWPARPGDNTNLDSLVREGIIRPQDALLKVNYFGLRSYQDPGFYPVAAIIEDHTHDLIGDWASHSDADWCIASLRKSLPIPEGGILWSPKGYRLPDSPPQLEENDSIAAIRWKAMKFKTEYLAGKSVDKTLFRSRFVNTEEFFDRVPICSLDKDSFEYLSRFDVHDWYTKKRENWNLLREIEKEGISVMCPDGHGCYPFSVIVLFNSESERNRVRKALIDRRVYPAILWVVPSDSNDNVYSFSSRMLSIHCDGRYTSDDILQMKTIIESVL